MISKLVLLFSLLAGVTQAQVIDCAAGKSTFQINSQGFSPNPPVVGENATLWIDYTVPEGVTVDSGTAKYSVSLNGIPFPPTTEDLCTQIECPQVPGTYNITSTSVWDGGVSGKIVSKIQWYNTAGTELLCSQTTFRVSFPNPKKFLRSGNVVYRYPLDFSPSSSSSSSSGSSSGPTSSTGSSSSRNSATSSTIAGFSSSSSSSNSSNNSTIRNTHTNSSSSNSSATSTCNGSCSQLTIFRGKAM